MFSGGSVVDGGAVVSGGVVVTGGAVVSGGAVVVGGVVVSMGIVVAGGAAVPEEATSDCCVLAVGAFAVASCVSSKLDFVSSVTVVSPPCAVVSIKVSVWFVAGLPVSLLHPAMSRHRINNSSNIFFIGFPLMFIQLKF